MIISCFSIYFKWSYLPKNEANRIVQNDNGSPVSFQAQSPADIRTDFIRFQINDKLKLIFGQFLRVPKYGLVGRRKPFVFFGKRLFVQIQHTDNQKNLPHVTFT